MRAGAVTEWMNGRMTEAARATKRLEKIRSPPTSIGRPAIDPVDMRFRRRSTTRVTASALAVGFIAAACLSACALENPRARAAPSSATETGAPAMHTESEQRAAMQASHAPDAAPIARIGPHRYRFPANAYADQRGPYPDGSVALIFLWPSLEPAAPGRLPTRGEPDYDARVRIGVVATGADGAEAALARLVSPDPSEPAQRDDPARNLDLRLRGEAVHGLTPYGVDREAAVDYLRRQSGTDAPDAFEDLTFGDWYLALSGDRLTTVVVCDDRRLGDGLQVTDGRLRRMADADGIATCAHHFAIADGELLVSVDYPRAVLHDWRRVEDAVRGFFDRHRIR